MPLMSDSESYLSETSDEVLELIKDDKTAQRLLAEALIKKARFWDALSDLEQYVGLEFPEGDTEHLASSVCTPASQARISDFDTKSLKLALERGFENSAAVGNGTAANVWLPQKYCDMLEGAGFEYDREESHDGCVAYSKYLEDDTYVFVHFDRMDSGVAFSGYATGDQRDYDPGDKHEFEIRPERLNSAAIKTQLNAIL